MRRVINSLLVFILLISVVGCDKVKEKQEEKEPQEIKEEPPEEEIIEESLVPEDYQDNGIFKDYYEQAYELLNTLSLEEKVGQTLLVRYGDASLAAQEKYQFGGFTFYAKDFMGKTKEEVLKMITDLENVSKIPILTAIDEEGGKVSRISSNPNLVSEPFKSPKELYEEGGFTKIEEDTINKSKILKDLRLNLNLAPVVDVSTNESDYIYSRTLGLPTDKVAEYAKVVITASKNSRVSYTLKHFPGYGNNLDTHKESSTDIKSKEAIMEQDIPPFREGIKAGAECVMVSHNIVSSIDRENPASLSQNINNVLRSELGFTGIIITDDLSMKALDSIDNVEVKALLAGNNILITTDYEKSFTNIMNALQEELITEEELNKIVFKILAWKYYKGLL